MYPVRQGISKVGYIAHCPDRIMEIGLGIIVLCLDREFYTQKVFAFLTWVQVLFITPVKMQSNRIKELLQGTRSWYANYQMTGKPTLTLTIAVAVKYASRKHGKHGVENQGYVVGGLAWRSVRVHQTYRSWFSIEMSYWMRNQVKTRTSTRNLVTQYLYAIISFLLKNIWLALLWSISCW